MRTVKLCIHRAADTIGGNCVEIMAPSGERILLDAGRPLDTPDDAPTPVPPSLDTSCPVLAVLLSHAHTDHCGLLDILPAEWPVYCGKATETLLDLSFGIRGKKLRQACYNWKSGTFLTIGPFTITPYLIDHSAFDAYAIQITVAGKCIVYSGDFRAHGRKATLTRTLMKHPPQNVDVLLMEGTNLASGGTQSKPTRNEQDLEEDFVTLFKETKGRVFVSWSSTNIDRTVTLYRASKRSGRVLVTDLYCILVLDKLKQFASIPQPEWGGKTIRAVVTQKMSTLLRRLGEGNFIDYLKKHDAVMRADNLTETPEKWVIMVRESLVADFTRKGITPNAHDAWAWSLWKGYVKQNTSQTMKEYLAPCRMEYIHSSGHASPDVLQQFAGALNPKMLVPMHGEAWNENAQAFSQLTFVPNGQWLYL